MGNCIHCVKKTHNLDRLELVNLYRLELVLPSSHVRKQSFAKVRVEKEINIFY